jgi:hypothetical protein
MIFHNKQKLKKYITTKPPLQKILQEILHKEDESKKKKKKNPTRVWEVSTSHNQNFKQQKQVNGTNHHINISIECQWTQLPHQKETIWQTGLKKEDPTICCL